MKRIALIAATLAALTTTAAAQEAERPTAVGVGIQGFLVGDLATGPAVTFQTGQFHIEGILTFFDDAGDDLDLGIGGRFWYAVSQTARSDFSVGGGLAFLVDGDGGGMGDDELDIELDIGAQLRAFVVPNVAISATLGFAIVILDGDDFIGLVSSRRQGFADLLGGLGITYFF